MADAHNWVADVLGYELLCDEVPERFKPYVEALVDDLVCEVDQ